DLGHSSGFYAGTWASSIDGGGYGSVELDVYGGWAGEITDGITIDVGAIYYAYPNSTKTVLVRNYDVFEVKGVLGFALGPVSTKVGIFYAPDQDSLSGVDNLYFSGDLGVSIPETPISLSAHLGYTDGFLTYTPDAKALDWSLGASATLNEKITLGILYTGVEGQTIDGVTDDAIVASLTARF
ncbi:MAG: hypothetical protein FJX31_11845, partial [Alphaproteobacteria bacterium]|nr:hypothetical protein [Alphaproteobacteria bacterium]